MNMVELCTNQSIAAVLPNKETFVEDFLFHNLDNRYDELRSRSTGDGGRGGLNLQIIRALKVILPAVSEQIKIADFFSALDKKIDIVTQQLGKAKIFKKGLLQQMFV
ncbi:MAG: restriction endonuclease subunit S [Pyrinomonadaceae bacterium]